MQNNHLSSFGMGVKLPKDGGLYFHGKACPGGGGSQPAAGGAQVRGSQAVEEFVGETQAPERTNPSPRARHSGVGAQVKNNLREGKNRSVSRNVASVAKVFNVRRKRPPG